MRRIIFIVSLSAVVVGALLFAYARGTQGEQARNDAGQPSVPAGSVVWQMSPNAAAPSAHEPSAGVKPEAAWEPWSKALAEARSLGKVVVARGVTNVADIGVLLRLGAHYVQGDLLCDWLPDWSFDFSEAVL